MWSYRLKEEERTQSCSLENLWWACMLYITRSLLQFLQYLGIPIPLLMIWFHPSALVSDPSNTPTDNLIPEKAQGEILSLVPLIMKTIHHSCKLPRTLGLAKRRYFNGLRLLLSTDICHNRKLKKLFLRYNLHSKRLTLPFHKHRPVIQTVSQKAFLISNPLCWKTSNCKAEQSWTCRINWSLRLPQWKNKELYFSPFTNSFNKPNHQDSGLMLGVLKGAALRRHAGDIWKP